MAYGVNAPFGLKPLYSINGGTWSGVTNTYYIYASADGVTTSAISLFTGDPVQWNTNQNRLNTITLYDPQLFPATPAEFSSTPIVGVFQGCEYFLPNGTLVKSAYWPASTQVLPGSKIKALVVDDPSVVYEVQISTPINAAANAFVGKPVFPNTNASNALYKGGFGSNFALMYGGGDNFDTVPNPNGGTYANNPQTGNTLTGQSAFYLCVTTSNTLAGDNHDYNKIFNTEVATPNVVGRLPLKAIGWSDNVLNQPQANPFGAATLENTPFLNVKVLINNHAYGCDNVGISYV